MLRHLDSVHFQIRRFQCSVCLKKFPRKERLKWHERIHLREEQALHKNQESNSKASATFDSEYLLPKISDKRKMEQQNLKLSKLDILLDIILAP